MKTSKDLAHEIANSIYKNGVKPLIVEKEKYAYIHDPVFNVKRNRVVAEVLKVIVRYNLENKNIVEKFCNYLIKTQNKDGSWNEIHPNYDQSSALITSIVGESLLLSFEKYPSKKLEKAIHLASRFVVSQQKSPGYFLKSKHYTADHLNVAATCGAFLAIYGNKFSDKRCIKVASETAKHICKYQFSDGSYPYTINKGSYGQVLDIPCIHYQGVTMYYLSKIDEVIKEKWLKRSLLLGAEWLSTAQKNNGKFDWSKSGLMFAYYLSGAYAFAFSSLSYVSKWDAKYQENAQICLDVLSRNTNGLCLRWEKDTWMNFPASLLISFKTALIGTYTLKHRLFRFGYGTYRQIARRRYSTKIDDKIFKSLIKIFNVKTSTIEPFSNYPDTFMTSETLDCLSYSSTGAAV